MNKLERRSLRDDEMEPFTEVSSVQVCFSFSAVRSLGALEETLNHVLIF